MRRRLASPAPTVPAPEETAAASQPRRSSQARLLDTHPFFDDEWYSLVTGVRGERTALVDHYLRTAQDERVSPHPLFDPAWFTEHYTGEVADRDPFLVFARRRRVKVLFHPLFSLTSYRRSHPDVAEHPHGVLGHYLEHSAAGEPVAPSEWWPTEEGSLRDFLVARTRVHKQERAESAGPVAARRSLERTSKAIAGGQEPAASAAVVDVVLNPGPDADLLRRCLDSLTAQTHTRWHVLAAGRPWGDDVAATLGELLPAGSFTVVDVGPDPRPLLDHEVVGAGQGEWITFLDTSDTWTPQRLARLLAHAEEHGSDVVCDVLEVSTESGGTRLLRRGAAAGDPTRSERLPRARLLVARAAWTSRGLPQLRADLPAGHELALTRALAAPAGIAVVPHVGVHRDSEVREAARRVPVPFRPPFDHSSVRGWDDVVLRSRLDAAAPSRSPLEDDLVTVVVPTYLDTTMTLRAVTSVMQTCAGTDERPATRVQVIVVDNGCRPEQSALLDAFALRWRDDQARVEVLHNHANLGFSLGNDVALPHVRGAVTVFLNNDTVVTEGWLTPLRAALEDPAIMGAQSLLRYPDGTVQCAGVAFPSTGGLPHGFGQWHPVEDLAGVGALRFHAVTAACLAMRTADVRELGGFDPVFTNGMEDVDLCLRAGELAASRGGRRDAFVVCEDSVVWHHESVTPGRFKRHQTNRRVFIDRWSHRLPGDDVELWGALGFEVTGHRGDIRAGRDKFFAVQRPILRRARLQVDEAAPRLRWAIKNPAPGGARGELWGDTHFAESLAEALRDAGQEVVVDRRQAWDRRSADVDDVALVLRGLGNYTPLPEQVNLAWVISHPDDVGGPEASRYDRVLGASVHWAAEQTRRWGFEVEAMLQATDHRRFHPDLAAPDSGHPVLFVGSSRMQQRPLIMDAVERNVALSVYGTEWRGIIPARFLKAEYLDNRQVGAAYRSAGVVLNDHWEDMRAWGFLSNRLFDAVASGARVLTDDVTGLGDVFGRSVQVVRDADDLVRLASLNDPDAVFGDDAERRSVAERIRREHSFTARAERLVEVAVQAHRRRGFDRLR